jgi:hypothetical protein
MFSAGDSMSKLIQTAAFGSAIAIALAAPATEAATCAPQDMRGNWNIFATEHFTTTGDIFFVRCDVRIDSLGRVLLNSVCVADTGERSGLSGQFVARLGCRLTGTLTQNFPPPDPVSSSCPIEGALSQDKLTAGGVCNVPGDIMLFQMIRRP